MSLIKNMFITALFLNFLLLATASPDYSDGTYDTTIAQACSIVNVTAGLDDYQRQGFVHFWNLSNYHSSCNTTVYIETKPDYRLFVRFSEIRINCNRGAYVHIRGNTSSTGGICGVSNNYPAVYSVANYLAITYFNGHSWAESNEEYIKLYYTASPDGYCMTHDHDDDSSDEDDDDEHHTSEEFRCKNKRCIEKRVKCDGYDNCGDWSDENYDACGLSTEVIIAISVTCSVTGLALLVCVACTCMSKGKKRANKTDTTAETGHTSTQRRVETAAPMESLHCPITAPPPYTQSKDASMNGGNTYVGWAAPYEGLEFGAKPPMYDDISIDKTSKK